MHADLHGASSVVIKNPSGQPVPPKTLNESGHMAVCYSAAWDNKVVASAWWVESSQVSKTAPSGEYLTAGSFMIRGKKNFLMPSHLIFGFGFMFKLEEGSVERHRGERRVRMLEDQISTGQEESSAQEDQGKEDVEIAIDENAASDDDDDDDKKEDAENINEKKLEEIEEEQEKEGSESEEEDDKEAFPDTSIEVKYSTETGGVQVKARGVSESLDNADDATKAGTDSKEEELIVFSKNTKKKTQGKKIANKPSKPAQEQGDPKGKDGNQMNKRGKKGKNKKIKDKYKDQDEEDRELRMQILQVSQKDNKRNKKKQQQQQQSQSTEEQKKKKAAADNAKKNQSKINSSHKKAEGGGGGAGEDLQEDLEEDDEKVANVNAELDMLDSLTGKEKHGKTRVYFLLVSNSLPSNILVDIPVKDNYSFWNFRFPLFLATHIFHGKILFSGLYLFYFLTNTFFAEKYYFTLFLIFAFNFFPGIPLPEDEILFAIPVVAPYNTMTNYKFKVKVTPGTGKRGKATKTALNMFVTDKATLQREKDLLKSVKDQDLARNLPGKVKLSAPHLQKSKAKKK